MWRLEIGDWTLERLNGKRRSSSVFQSPFFGLRQPVQK